MALTIERVTTPAQMDEAWAIRFTVFVDEQRVPDEEEVDALDRDPSTVHVLARLDGRPVGTARLLPDSPGHVHIGRVAVLIEARREGVGAALMAVLEDIAARHFADDDEGTAESSCLIELSAQETAMDFYRRIGYHVVTGERYLDAGIWHQDMAKKVTQNL